MYSEYKIDKVTAAIVHIEAATLFILRGEYPEAAHTLLAASRTVLWDLGKRNRNKMIVQLDQAVERMVRPGFEREWRYYQNRAANFFKHADKDPEDVLDCVSFDQLNEMDLLLLTLVVGQFRGKLTPRLTISLAHGGFASGDWFDFKGYCKEVTNGQIDYEHYQGMNKTERTNLFLKAFEKLPPTLPH